MGGERLQVQGCFLACVVRFASIRNKIVNYYWNPPKTCCRHTSLCYPPVYCTSVPAWRAGTNRKPEGHMKLTCASSYALHAVAHLAQT